MRIKISHIICAENALSCLTISCRSFLTGTSGTRSRILTSVALGIVAPIVVVVLNVEFVGRDQFLDERSLLTRSMCRNPTKNLTLVSTKVHLQWIEKWEVQVFLTKKWNNKNIIPCTSWRALIGTLSFPKLLNPHHFPKRPRLLSLVLYRFYPLKMFWLEDTKLLHSWGRNEPEVPLKTKLFLVWGLHSYEVIVC